MSVTEEICPNCGAPLSLVNGRCEFCEVPLVVSSGGAVTAPAPGTTTAGPVAPVVADDFSMEVEEVSQVDGRGTMVGGRTASGSIAVGASVILTHKQINRLFTCTAVDQLTEGGEGTTAGHAVGLFLVDTGGEPLDKHQVKAGDWLHAPGHAAPG